MPLTNGSQMLIRILLFSSLTFKMHTKNYFFKKSFCANYFLTVHLHHFSKITSQKKSQSRRNQGFSYYFCLVREGSGSGVGSGSGIPTVPLTNGSGSRRPKNIRIGRIRSQIRLRIRNTGLNTCHTFLRSLKSRSSNTGTQYRPFTAYR